VARAEGVNGDSPARAAGGSRGTRRRRIGRGARLWAAHGTGGAVRRARGSHQASPRISSSSSRGGTPCAAATSGASQAGQARPPAASASAVAVNERGQQLAGQRKFWSIGAIASPSIAQRRSGAQTGEPGWPQRVSPSRRAPPRRSGRRAAGRVAGARYPVEASTARLATCRRALALPGASFQELRLAPQLTRSVLESPEGFLRHLLD
jgi:hypothetical protein